MKKIEHRGLRVWIEIDKKAIHSNYYALRKFISKTNKRSPSSIQKVQMMGVVKSNAYGHNLTEFALELEKLSIDWLAVDSLVEALSLRDAGVEVPILVLGYTLPEMFSRAVGKNIYLTISNIEGLRTFIKNAYFRKIPIHLKVDTGMHRQGFLLHEKNAVLKILARQNKKVNIAGLYTHFASAKDPNNCVFTNTQIEEFMIWRDALSTAGFKPLLHCSATGGAIVFPDASFDIVRTGIGLYGIYPSDEIYREFKDIIKLSPVLSWKTIVGEVKKISRGEGVGYGLTYRTSRATRIAVCPVGYWHGFPRALSNNAEVIIRGKRAKVVGLVSMDMIVIDVTDIPNIKTGDEVVLIGKQGKESITALDISRLASTAAYEIITRLNPLIKRIYK